MNHRFLKACRREPVDATPIWLMRQAGRYLPAYRAVREKHSMLEVIRSPHLACEVTLQPIRAFDLDAAIIFADILTVLMGMGLNLEFVKGGGPVIDNPLTTPADVDALRTPPAAENVPYTLEAIRMVRRELDGQIPLIGFAGAPFTLASYAIEGGGSKNHVKVKTFMYRQPQAWHQLMEKLTQVVSEYLIAQVEAGAQAVQIFDSWAGILATGDYRGYVLPYTQRVVENVRAQTDVPIIYFGTNLNAMLPTIAQISVDVLGMDWRINLDDGWAQVGDRFAIQGNLDPAALFAPWSETQRRVEDILRRVNGRAGHIFNLGHGILPETPVENVKRLADYVHERTSITAKESPQPRKQGLT